jgi:hypothetical protein
VSDNPNIAPNGNLIVSATRIDDFLDCNRRWWFKNIAALPEVQRDYFTFGTVLHACVERWKSADRTGRVPSPVPEPLKGQQPGAPVDPFPPGWECVEERGARACVTPNEAKLIRELLADAIEKGIIERADGVEVEREFTMPLVEGVDLNGTVDWLVRETGERIREVHDHKTFGEGSLRYLKQPGPKDEAGNDVAIDEPHVEDDGTSKNSIGHNQQVLTYAAATSRLDGYDGPVRLRHNQFPKFRDPKGVRKVHALVSPKRLSTHWAFLQETARKMLVVSKIKKWADTPGPESTDSCSRYGGCPFQGICSRQETPELYTVRVKKQVGQAAPRPNVGLEPRKTRKKAGGSSMDMFARVKSQKAAQAAPAAAQTPPPPPTAVPVAPPAPAPQAAPAINAGPTTAQPTVSGGAPWAKPNCPGCKGVGINRDGRPCKICDKTAKKDNRPLSEQYVVEITDEGAVAVARDEHAEALKAAGFALEWEQSDVRVEASAPAAPPPAALPVAPKPAPAAVAAAKVAAQTPPPAEPPVRPSVAAMEATEPPAEPKADKKAKGERGRPRVGLSLYLGVVQLKGADRPVVSAAELMNKIGAEMATDMGAESYWTLDPHKRKDRLKQRGEQIAESLGRTVVVFPGGTNDFDLVALFNALEPFAETVLERLG